jgi:hypothetical protein
VLFRPEIAVTLPHGLWDADGVCHRRAWLRALSGHEELLLGSGAAPDPQAASELLAACMPRLGGYPRVDVELAGALTRGDRQHLALHLRALLYGDRIALVARCPGPSCGAAADVDVHISELAPDSEGTPDRPEVIELDTPSGRASVREPTGDDDLALHGAGGDPRTRSALLWSRLVELDGQPLAPAAFAALPAATRHAVALALAEHSRAPDLSFVARCPSCRAWLELALDPFALLARELASGTDRLLAELHCLAYHYHWSEADILALPRPRRWRYLELLRRELEGRALLDGMGRM